MNLTNRYHHITLIGLFFVLSTFFVSAKRTESGVDNNDSENIIGDWFAQIDLPQDKATILLEFEIADKENCTIRCTWSGPYPTESESGKAKYKLNENKLIITFLNEEELIRTDHIFQMENIYNIKLTNDRLVIFDNRMFRNVDVIFGRGYGNRGFSKIIFPDNE